MASSAPKASEAKRFILSRLRELEEEYGFSVIFAVERSSRLWGTSHSQSDFDVKFFYVYPRRKYYSIEGGTVDRMKRVYGPRGTSADSSSGPDKHFDVEISGFELARTLLAKLRKPDPVAFEIIYSSIVYVDHPLLKAFRGLVGRVVNRSDLARAYVRYALSSDRRRKDIQSKIARGEKPTANNVLKLASYVARAALSALWLSGEPAVDGERAGDLPFNISALIASLVDRGALQRDDASVIEEIIVAIRRGDRVYESKNQRDATETTLKRLIALSKQRAETAGESSKSSGVSAGTRSDSKSNGAADSDDWKRLDKVVALAIERDRQSLLPPSAARTGRGKALSALSLPYLIAYAIVAIGILVAFYGWYGDGSY